MTREYQANVHGLVDYLSDEYGLEKKHTLKIVRSTFSFIRQSVLNSGHPFKVVEFGTFSRSLRRAREAFGAQTAAHYVLRLIPARHHSRIELAGDGTDSDT